jgi:hypothetical protein
MLIGLHWSQALDLSDHWVHNFFTRVKHIFIMQRL